MNFHLLQMGGAITWIILACGALAFGVFVERSLHLHRARIRAEDFLLGIVNILRRRNVTEALTICEETPGPVARVVRIAILHRDDAKEALVSALDEASHAETSRMERRLVVVSTVAQVAPLLGLLGTVLGMIDSLLAMQRNAPLIQTADVMGGLLRALITTAVGLMVAIPCYVAFNLLLLKIDRIVLDMQRAMSDIVAFLTASGAPEGTGSDEKASRP